MNPIVLVTQDSCGRTCINWFEDENGYHALDPLASIVAARHIEAGRNVTLRTANQVADTWLLLLQVPAYDVSYLATHTVSDGVLEPVPEVAA